MRRAALAAVARRARLAAPAAGPGPGAVYQKQPKQSSRFAGDTLARYEWTRGIPVTRAGEPIAFIDQNRYRVQARPRIELRFGPFELGAGGEFNYSEDENDVAPEGESLTIIRDNYRSRDARLDLAYGKVTFGPVTVQGGRFLMPIPLTEMIWDRDLRPQGGAATITLGDAQSPAPRRAPRHLLARAATSSTTRGTTWAPTTWRAARPRCTAEARSSRSGARASRRCT